MPRVGNTPGRLLREPNPTSGTVPGFTNQFFDKDNYPHETRPDDPLPVTDSSATQALADLKTTIEAQDNKSRPVDGNGNSIFTKSNPGNVSDDEVLAKVSELDSKVNGIIDGTTPASTQLTGSYIEEVSFPDIVVPAASQKEVIVFTSDIDMLNDCHKINFSARGSSLGSFKAHYRPYLSSSAGAPGTRFETIFEDTNGLVFVGNPIGLDVPRGAIRFENAGTSDVTYSEIKLYKFIRKGA